MYCPNCGQQIAENSKFCQFCGERIQPTKSNQTISNLPKTSKKRKKQNPLAVKVVIGFTIGIIVLIVGLIIAAMMKAQTETVKINPSQHTSIFSFSDTSPTSNTGKFNDVDAFTCAEDIVTRNLKAPSTAKFCKITEATCAYDASTNYWTVKGWVDAQNSFGAMIRQNWTAKFQPTVKGNDVGYEHGTCVFD